MVRLGEKAKDSAVELVKRRAAQDILASIGKIRDNNGPVSLKQWIFCLVQNAVNTAKARGKQGLKIEVEYDGKVFAFRHNAGYFTFDNLEGLIYGTKVNSQDGKSERLEDFGKDFLATHLVSRKAKVRGFLREGMGVYFFQFYLDRTGKTVDEVSSSIQACFSQLDNIQSVSGSQEYWTEYTYLVMDALGSKAVAEGIPQLIENAQFLLAFNPIDEISVGSQTFTKKKVETTNGISKVTLNNSRIYLIKSENNPQIQVGLLCDNEGISKTPITQPIFTDMPLTTSSEIASLPFCISSPAFELTSYQDSLTNTQNNLELLSSSFELYIELLERLFQFRESRELTRLYQIIPYPTTQEYHYQNPLASHLTNLQYLSAQKILSTLPLVKTNAGMKPITNTTFPDKKIDDKDMDNSSFDAFCLFLAEMGKAVPEKAEFDNWVSVALQVQRTFPEVVSVYSFADLRSEIVKSLFFDNSLHTFEELDSKFQTSSQTLLLHYYELLDTFYGAGLVPVDFARYILPSQTGIVGPSKRQLASTGADFQLLLEDSKNPIPAELKDIISKIGKSLRSGLVHEKFAGYKIIQDYIKETLTVDAVLAQLFSDEALGLPLRVHSLVDERVVGWVELFRWCILNGRLTAGFPVITKSLDVVPIEDLATESLLMPNAVVEAFEAIYPENKILHSIYLTIEEPQKTQLTDAMRVFEAFIFVVPQKRQELTLSAEKLRAILFGNQIISDDVHTILCPADQPVTVLPMWSEITTKISQDSAVAGLLFDFFISYVAENACLERGVLVSCSCGQSHEVLPVVWLANLKTGLWVPIKTGCETQRSLLVVASRGNIEGLIGPTHFNQMLTENRDLAMNLLPHFGFDRLDLTIKIHSLSCGKSELELRDYASDLVGLAGEVETGEVKRLVAKRNDPPPPPVIVEKLVEVPKIVEVEKIVEVPVEVEKVVEKVVEVERIVEKIVEVPAPIPVSTLGVQTETRSITALTPELPLTAKQNVIDEVVQVPLEVSEQTRKHPEFMIDEVASVVPVMVEEKAVSDSLPFSLTQTGIVDDVEEKQATLGIFQNMVEPVCAIQLNPEQTVKAEKELAPMTPLNPNTDPHPESNTEKECASGADEERVELSLEPEVEPIPEYVSYPVPNITTDTEIKVNLLNTKEAEENNIIGRNLTLIVHKIIKDSALRFAPEPIYSQNQQISEVTDFGEMKMFAYSLLSKSTVASKVHLSKEQIARAQVQKNSFIIVAIDDFIYLQKQLSHPLDETNISAELVERVVARSHVLGDVYLILKNQKSDEVNVDESGCWLLESVWRPKPSIKLWLNQKFNPESTIVIRF
jgi:hypothetical protein